LSLAQNLDGSPGMGGGRRGEKKRRITQGGGGNVAHRKRKNSNELTVSSVITEKGNRDPGRTNQGRAEEEGILEKRKEPCEHAAWRRGRKTTQRGPSPFSGGKRQESAFRYAGPEASVVGK